MKSSRISLLMILIGILMIVLPPLFARQIVDNGLPILLAALTLILYGIWRLVYDRFLKPKTFYLVRETRANRDKTSQAGTVSPGELSDGELVGEPAEIAPTHRGNEINPVGGSHRANTTTTPWRRSGSPKPTQQRSSNASSSDAHGVRHADIPEEERFDTDPEIVRAAIAAKLQQAVLELFDIDPDLVRAALAKILQRQLDALFDTDPDVVRQTIAELLERQLLELFDIDPLVVHEAIAARSEQQLAELFDTDPDAVKAIVAELIRNVLFDIDPDELRGTLAKLSEQEILELFDTDPDLLQAALRQRFSVEILELFDRDPVTLRATFAWRQNGLAELFDADPEALRALWEAQKALPKGAEREFVANSSLTEARVERILAARQDLLESLARRSLQRLRSEHFAARGTQPPPLLGGKISLEVLRRLVVERIIEEKVHHLEIQRRAVSGILVEADLPAATKKKLLLELSYRLTDARTQAKQLRQETQAQIARDQALEQGAVRQPRTRPRGDLDPNLAEKLRQRMLERSRQK